MKRCKVTHSFIDAIIIYALVEALYKVIHAFVEAALRTSTYTFGEAMTVIHAFLEAIVIQAFLEVLQSYSCFSWSSVSFYAFAEALYRYS